MRRPPEGKPAIQLMGKRSVHKEEKGLSVSVKQFRDLSEKSLVGMYLIQNWVFTYVNVRFTEIFGYASDELINRMGPKDLVLPEDWHIVERNIRKRLSGEAEFANYEFRGITKDRRIIHIEGYGSRTTHLRKPAIIGTLLDISRRKYAEDNLRQAEQKYRNIFQNALEGIFQTTPDGRLIAANPALARMFGYDSPEDLLTLVTNVRHQLYIDPAKRVEFEQILEENDSVLSFECQFYKKDRSTIWVSMNARRVRDGDNRTLYYEGTIEDVTEKKKAAEELLLLNELNTTIIGNSPVAIFTVDKNGRVASSNPALLSIAGLKEGDEARIIGFNWLTNPYSIKCGITGHLRRGLQGEPFQLWDFPFLTYRGDKKIFIDFKGVPLKRKDGSVEGLLCIIEETTDRVRTRSQLMEEAKMSALGRLAAGIAHELSNPLATMVTYADLASHFLHSIQKRLIQQHSFEELHGFLHVIEEQAFRCKNLIGDIFSLWRHDGLELSDIDINELLEDVLEQRETAQLNVRIIKDFVSPLLCVRGDSRFLRQTFLNVINNGIDAVNGRMNPTIRISTGVDNNRVKIEIQDNGWGISDVAAGKIFEPFFTTKGPQRGVGLGLSLCYEFLRSIGGTIAVESKAGHGTTFFITIPAKQEEEEG